MVVPMVQRYLWLTRAIEELHFFEPLARELAREKGINSMCCRLKPEGNYILCVNICEPIGIHFFAAFDQLVSGRALVNFHVTHRN